MSARNVIALKSAAKDENLVYGESKRAACVRYSVGNSITKVAPASVEDSTDTDSTSGHVGSPCNEPARRAGS